MAEAESTINHKEEKLKAIIMYFAVVVIIGAALISIWGEWWQYDGVTEVTLEQAALLTREHNQEDKQSIVVYSTNDKITVSYQFWGKESDARRYGIPMGEFNKGKQIADYVFAVLEVAAMTYGVVLLIQRRDG